MADQFHIRALTDEDIELFVEHIVRHLAESGQPGTPIRPGSGKRVQVGGGGGVAAARDPLLRTAWIPQAQRPGS